MATLTLSSSSYKSDFEEYGFCVVDGVYSEAELAGMEAFFDDYLYEGHLEHHGMDGGAQLSQVDRAKQQVRVLHPHRQSDKVMQWYLHPNVADLLEEFFGRPAFGAQTMYYYKPPGSKGQGMHQDNMYLITQPATCMGVWTPIDSADEENGCLWMSPGSHRSKLICPEDGKTERWLNYGDSHITKFPRDLKPVPVPVKRGQTLFFTGNVIHGSGPNRSKDRWRRTFIGHYVDDATDSIARFYHPVLNMQGETVSNIEVYQGGGPCGDGWEGATH